MFQIVRLEETRNNLNSELEAVNKKLHKKSELCKELEHSMNLLTSDNDRVAEDNRTKSLTLIDYATKLEETSDLLKVASSTNKKLQKRLNVKKTTSQVNYFPFTFNFKHYR